MECERGQIVVASRRWLLARKHFFDNAPDSLEELCEAEQQLLAAFVNQCRGDESWLMNAYEHFRRALRSTPEPTATSS